jgi:SAM-dependent methyltransferase
MLGFREMPSYGDANYWNARYKVDHDEPFDWLFEYNDVALLLNALLPERNVPLLLVGSGNAPFSPDLFYKGEYRNLTNIDLSDVVVEQMTQKFPEQTWLHMNVQHMDFADNSFPAILDKSLIDTLLCYSDRSGDCSGHSNASQTL